MLENCHYYKFSVASADFDGLSILNTKINNKSSHCHEHTCITQVVLIKQNDSFYLNFCAVPSASPEVIKGGYRFDHRECEEGIERRRVCMFWKVASIPYYLLL
jgi:hypothetical protein